MKKKSYRKIKPKKSTREKIRITGKVCVVIGILGMVCIFGVKDDLLSYVLTYLFFLFFGIALILATNEPKAPYVSPADYAAMDAAIEADRQEKARQQARQQAIEKRQEEFEAGLSVIPHVDIVLSDLPTPRRDVATLPALKSKNIIRTSRPETIFPLVIIDVETTGLQTRNSEIIEVSAIKYMDRLAPTSCFTTLVKPKVPIPSKASAVNHITNEMVADAPAFEDIADSLSEFIAGCNLAGHNLIGFDIPFLFAQGVTFPAKAAYYDTLDLAKFTLTSKSNRRYDHHTGGYFEDYDVENYKLDTLCEHYHIYRSVSHRSLSDCYATGLVLRGLIRDKTDMDIAG